MNTAYESVTRKNAIATGFTGWIIFNNVAFVFALFLISRSSSFEEIIKALAALNFVIALALLYARRPWMCIGACLAFLTNSLIWLLTRWTTATSDLWVILIPFPLGYFLA